MGRRLVEGGRGHRRSPTYRCDAPRGGVVLPSFWLCCIYVVIGVFESHRRVVSVLLRLCRHPRRPRCRSLGLVRGVCGCRSSPCVGTTVFVAELSPRTGHPVLMCGCRWM
ncbi:hypothetical protein BDW22DRAFT_205179 [Trametopsis cervina]|nr:hypothetical protein BDW22DRAFT_205179 [Trametopsis cervina]